MYNTGSVVNATPVKIVDRLPAGLSAVNGAGGCTVAGGTVVTCEVGAVNPAELPAKLAIPVSVAGGASGSAVDVVEASEGGALGLSKSHVPVTFSSAVAGLGLANTDAFLSNADGTSDLQAGSHPYALTVALAFNTLKEHGNEIPTGGEPRSIDVKLPPGLVGNPTAVPQCPRSLFDEGEIGFDHGTGCPPSTQIGFVELSSRSIPNIGYPLFNLVPPPGDAAQFGFSITGPTNVFLDARVRTGGDNGITEHVPNAPERGAVFSSVTVWGTPGEASHDSQRKCGGQYAEPGVEGCKFYGPVEPFLTLPTSCQGPQEFTSEITSTWQNEAGYAKRGFLTHNGEDEPSGFTGCGRLVHFNPTIALAPETSYADTPTGLSVDVKVPQGQNREGLATAGVKDTKVVLPEGVAINPGQAAGLTACQPGQELIARGTELGESEAYDGPPLCPATSKVGTVEITTPLLRDKLVGDVYVLQSNPPHIELLVAASGDGVNLKLVGKVQLDPVTGRLTTTFPETPDTPFTDFKLTFSGGPQAALTTPTGCGTYSSSADFTPWSTPMVEDALLSSAFVINGGPLGSACASPLPFAPVMTAGSTTDQAAGYTDFSLLLTRGDGQQRIKSLSFKTPFGLLGMISHVPLCGEPQAALGSCPASSQIGHTVVTAGPGTSPLVVPQPGQPPAAIYLTGPYAGAPYGLSIVVPVIAGPFNLGVQVVRGKIEVDPHTSQLTITTGELPRIVEGIPTDLRSIYAVIDRPQFMFNPSNCNPMAFTGQAVSTTGATASLSSPFQVGSCRTLAFKPGFKVSTSGRTSRADGASLDAKVIYPSTPTEANEASSQANIAKVRVELPKRLPSRLTTLQKACTAAVFAANPAGCPAGSVVGQGIAVTPVLPGPVAGPAYFVSHGGAAFPSLIMVLQGQGITIDVEATTFINGKTGVTTSTFKSIPDVPVSSFELSLPEGPHSALAANGNLCSKSTALQMPTEFVAQNGALINQKTKITVSGCPKAKKSKAKKKKKG